MRAVVLFAIAGCSTPNDTKPRRPDLPAPRDAASDAVAIDAAIDAAAPKVVATPKTCVEARRAIETRHFIGWKGLPAGCTPDVMFGVKFDEHDWPARTLGKRSTRWLAVDVAGYDEPTVSVRAGIVVMFDGMNPELDGGWAPLAADLGEPEAKLDWHRDTLLMPRGEWVYPQRGITIFGRAAGDDALHIAVYAPTTLAEYNASLRPRFETTLR